MEISLPFFSKWVDDDSKQFADVDEVSESNHYSENADRILWTFSVF